VKSICTALVAGFVLPGAAVAQRLPVSIGEEVVVTATRVPQRLSQSNQHVTVITAEEIAAGGYQSVTGILQARGGLEITQSGGRGQPSSAAIRGAEPRHTLVLIDGLRIGSATAGGTAFEHIPVNQIDRIEIVPGPLSSVYGPDAIGGAIQIFTRRGGGAAARVEAGSFGTRGLSGYYGRSLGATELSLSAGASATRGFDASRPTLPFAQHHPDDDGYRNQNFSARLDHDLGAGHALGATAFYSKGRTDFDAGLATNDLNDQSLSAWSLYSRNRLAPLWTSLLRIGSTRDESITAGAFPSIFRTDQEQATWQNDFALAAGTFTAGLEYLDQRVASDVAFKQSSRTVESVFLGYRGDVGAHALQLNARRDDNSQFGARNTGSAGYSYRLSPAWRARAGAGTAFKAPTFNDLYFPDQPPFFFSNPDLQPERSRSREAGLDYEAGGQRVAATLFQTRVTDLITIFTDPVTFVSTTQNLGRARIEGLELNYNGVAAGWQSRAQLTLQDPRDEDTGAQLRRRAKRHGAVAAQKEFGQWRAGGEVVASGARYDSTTEAASTRMHGYGLVNLVGGYRFSREWSVNARWNNVFNRDYELVQFFNTPDASVFVWLAWQPR
jgi:vitamin B12 transporter